jgi:hypothetical protein
MGTEIKSEGKCIYCGETFSQKEITKHLITHLKKIEKEKTAESKPAYLLDISDGKYFLQVLVNGTASFKTLDTFLRKIWLECCGHMSNFSHKHFKISMNHKFEDVLSPNLKFRYIYDYGSTTELDNQMKGRFVVPVNNNVMLLSRNEPLNIMCLNCKAKTATVCCVVHIYDGGFYCDDCAIIHENECPDFEDYARTSIINSPRVGVCGYEGGTIDTDRDGVYEGG